MAQLVSSNGHFQLVASDGKESTSRNTVFNTFFSPLMELMEDCNDFLEIAIRHSLKTADASRSCIYI